MKKKRPVILTLCIITKYFNNYCVGRLLQKQLISRSKLMRVEGYHLKDEHHNTDIIDEHLFFLDSIFVKEI